MHHFLGSYVLPDSPLGRTLGLSGLGAFVLVFAVLRFAKVTPPTIKIMWCGTVAGFILLAAGLWAHTAAFWFPDRAWAYSAEYGVLSDQIIIEKKPHDCDFDRAPYGNKECHFKRVVTFQPDTGKPTSIYVGWDKVED